ncbi:Cell division integral membrane protein, YggT and half-length relatives [hydrothermal vent metagenome]|uniref:Cell division integral membrane protein, YggT and half-length relatives n=1 Tax=hydrothermal vent metagenome TaxID=652676 RepID=A0A3B0Y9H2_9ZZZZ
MNPLVFLINILFQLYATALLIRLLLQWVRADFYNPVSQFIIKITDPVVKPLRRIIPGYAGIDIATLLLALLVMIIKTIMVRQTLDPLVIILFAFPGTLMLIISIFLYSIIIQAVLSWVNPDPYNPIVGLLNSITNPILKHARRFIPPAGGVDLSSLFAIIALMTLQYSISYIFLNTFGIPL